jgi:septal ring factor EnvC (AmiA/AmiB activator)
LLEEYSKRFEEHDKKFDIIVQELKELRKTTNELTLILSEVSVILKEHTKYINDLRSAVGSLGRRMDLDLEKLILSIYREQLKRIGIDEKKIRKLNILMLKEDLAKKIEYMNLIF